MGKRHFKGGSNAEDKKRRKEAAEKWRSVRGDETTRTPWVLENARLAAFYKAQKFLNSDEDCAAFIKHLQTPLPACFRIWSDYAFADELRNQMLQFAGQTMEVDGVQIKAAEQLHWYPGGYGYKLGTDRRSIRKLEGLNDLHKWMMQHTDNGNITRQEAVSMVPPLALNVEPHHRCLDMCAAPGSKTSQLLEIVNRSLTNPETEQGAVVANDADTDRAYMLVHQCKRINSPLLVVTTHKGQQFPTITETEGVAKAAPYFDRVLCDVPCSGDGTLRKNPAIWAKWSTSGGVTLHPLQLMIAQRGLQLLKEGGLMVYSTCSMSPYEDEAVVAELLRSARGGLELVDAREFLPLFRCRKGLTSWVVVDDTNAVKQEARERRTQKARENAAAKAAVTSTAATEAKEGEATAEEVKEETNGDEMEVAPAAGAEEGAADANSAPQATGSAHRQPKDFSHIEDADLRRCLEMGMDYFPDFSAVPEHLQRKIRQSCFPPTAEELQWMHLERCLRCVPQDEDTGGFFVATLRKVARPSTTAAEATPTATSTTETADAEAEAAAEAAAAEAEAGNAEGDADEAAAAAAAEDGEGEDTGKGGKRGGKPVYRGPVEFQQWDEDTFQRMKVFYGFRDSLTRESFFIREDATQARNNGDAASSAAKSIYLIPASVRALMSGDRDGRLKVVTAGVKVFEKKVLRSGDIDYRLIQDGISFLEPHITKRKVSVTIQDFCNILGGGLVSYSTLDAETLVRLNSIPTGVVILVYEYRPEDVVGANDEEGQKRATAAGAHRFTVIGWKGSSRALNVMCGKVEIEAIKHQLAALGVLRPKVNAVRLTTDIVVPSTTEAAETGASAGEGEMTDEAAVGDAAPAADQEA